MKVSRSRYELCLLIAHALSREAGIHKIKPRLVKDCLQAWLRDPAGPLPHPEIAGWCRVQFNAIEAARPGHLRKLR